MEQPLANLARAQDELRNALSVNLGELRSAHDGVAAAAANALRERRREREESRTALEREASERRAVGDEADAVRDGAAGDEGGAGRGAERGEGGERERRRGEARRDSNANETPTSLEKRRGTGGGG